MDAREGPLRFDGERFDPPGGEPRDGFAKWDCDVGLDVGRPQIRTSVVTEGWIELESRESKEYGRAEPTGAYRYSFTARPDLGVQQLGLISEAGAVPYTGEVRVEVRVGEPGRSRVVHFKELTGEYASPETVFFVVETSADRLAWVHDELLRRPSSGLTVEVKVAPYVNVGQMLGYGRRRPMYFPPDNDHAPGRECPILGAELVVADAAAPGANTDDDFDGPVVRSASAPPTAQVPVVPKRYLIWIIALQAAILLVTLLKH